MKKHKDVHDIPLFMPHIGEIFYIEVQRPDYAHCVNSDFDFSGLTPIVKEVFGEVPRNISKGKKDEQKTEMARHLLDDLIQRTLVNPTWDDFEKTRPLDMKQKMIIYNWVWSEVDHFKDILRNENVAMEIAWECMEMRKMPHEVVDIHGEYCGIYHRYFNRAMTEYIMYVKQDKQPISKSTSAIDDFLKITGLDAKNETKTGLENTSQLLMKNMKRGG